MNIANGMHDIDCFHPGLVGSSNRGACGHTAAGKKGTKYSTESLKQSPNQSTKNYTKYCKYGNAP